MLQTLKKVASLIDQLNEFIGRATSWLVILMVLVITYDVAMRYLFQSGSVALQELEWHLFALIFLLGSGYTLKQDGHVRVDILYKSRFVSEKSRAWINLTGTFLLLFPFCLLIIFNSFSFVEASYLHNEHSPDPGGLSSRWLLKLMIPVGFGLIFIQGISLAIHSVLSIAGDKK